MTEKGAPKKLCGAGCAAKNKCAANGGGGGEGSGIAAAAAARCGTAAEVAGVTDRGADHPDDYANEDDDEGI